MDHDHWRSSSGTRYLGSRLTSHRLYGGRDDHCGQCFLLLANILQVRVDSLLFGKWSGRCQNILCQNDDGWSSCRGYSLWHNNLGCFGNLRLLRQGNLER